jgi:hypothetical protein
LFEKAAPFPDHWLHDEWLAIVAAAFNGLIMLDETLIDYRQHESNQVGQRKLNLFQKAQKFSESLSERSTRLYGRAAQLASFIQAAEGIPDEYRKMVSQKLRFEEMRSHYPQKRLRRVPHILRQLLLGNYNKFGTGLKDAVRNLLQPG